MSSITTALPQTKDEFAHLVAAIEAGNYIRPDAYAIGWAVAHGDQIISCIFPTVNCRENYGTAALLSTLVEREKGTMTYRVKPSQLEGLLKYFDPFKEEWLQGDGLKHTNISAIWSASQIEDVEMVEPWEEGEEPPFALNRYLFPVIVFIDDLDEPPVDVCDALLRLHLLSNRKVQPHEINLEGQFGILPNVAWTDEGPFLAENFESRVRLPMLAAGIFIHVYSVDKFPPMLDFVIPGGVRVGDGARVRLGAHLGEGTTVMQEGFVNFNAGTAGASMVEGRISAGVFVGDGSDLGGSCSTMGTLSGGGKEVITVGEGCLIGANAGIGISLGDHCTVEAGLYITAGMPVMLIGPDGAQEVKARELSGKPGLLFRRNGILGQVEVVPNDNASWEGLNEMLHKNT